MLRIEHVAGLMMALLIVTPGWAASDNDKLRQQAQAACTDDAMKLCSEVASDELKASTCIQNHKAELSPTCSKAVKAMGK